MSVARGVARFTPGILQVRSRFIIHRPVVLVKIIFAKLLLAMSSSSVGILRIIQIRHVRLSSQVHFAIFILIPGATKRSGGFERAQFLHAVRVTVHNSNLLAEFILEEENKI